MPTPACQVSTRTQFQYLTYLQHVTGILGPNPLLVGSPVNQAGVNLRHKLSFPYARKWHIPATGSVHTGAVSLKLFCDAEFALNSGSANLPIGVFPDAIQKNGVSRFAVRQN